MVSHETNVKIIHSDRTFRHLSDKFAGYRTRIRKKLVLVVEWLYVISSIEEEGYSTAKEDHYSNFFRLLDEYVVSRDHQ